MASADPDPVEPVAGRARWRAARWWLVTGAAGLFVFVSLVAPDRLSRLKPLAFLRIPVEILLVLALLIGLPRRPRRIVALGLGALLGLATIAKVADIGFYASLARPFDLWSDWGFLPPAVNYLQRNSGPTDAVLAVVGAIVLAVAVLALSALSLLRLSSIAAGHRVVAARVIGALGVVWLLLAVLGLRFVPGVPVASASAAGLVYDKVNQVVVDVRDQRTFVERSANDPFAATPPGQLLPGLRGKNVLLTFVESYGRVAIEDPGMAPRVTAVLDAGTASLRAAGYSARSGYLSSSTAGGGSWLAHSTLQSGLWINSEQRYDQFTASNRLTLSSAFKRAGWQTLGLLPANSYDWPEGALYHYDTIIDSRTLGYRGKTYTFQSIPDQYTLAALQRMEFGTARPRPLFAEIDLVSSHAPWEPVPPIVDWDTIGDGALFTGAAGATDPTDTVFQQDVGKVHADYAATIEYSLTMLIQWVQRYGDDNLVLVFLGDHQPAPIVAGEDASREVPITILARDPAVLNQVAGWGWDDGLRPGPAAPVWRMDEFRDRFLTAFGSQPAR